MNRILVLLFLIVSIGSLAQQQTSSIGFIENKGQIVDQKERPNKAVKYLLNTGGLNVQLRKNGFSYDVYETKKHPLSKRQIEKQNPIGLIKEDTLINPNYSLEYIYHRIDIDFANSNPNVQLISEGKSTDFDNYYNVSNVPDGILDVHKFQRITYQNIYSNIDVVFFIPEDKKKPLEYNFIVKPGGKIADIQLKFNGVKTELVENKIKISTRFGEMEETLPLSWIEKNDTTKKEITIGYKKIKNNVYGFESSENIVGKKVVIDPVPIILWGTYYGGESVDATNSIETDINDNVYISGLTQSTKNIATTGTYQTQYIKLSIYNENNLFFAKFDSNGNRIWGTYFYYWNSVHYFPGVKIKTDSKSNLYFGVEEDISTDLATVGSFQQIKNNGYDGVLVKLNNLGVREWATYYGGNGDDIINSICIDSSENVYIAGTTTSTDVMSSAAAYQLNNNSTSKEQEAFIAKFNPQGNRLWGTFYGGTDNDAFYYIDISNDGFLYAVGAQNSNAILIAARESAGIPTPPSPIKASGVIVKFDLNGQFIWENSIFNNSIIYNAKLKDNTIYLVGETWNQTAIGSSGTFYQSYQNTLPSKSRLQNSYYKICNSFIVSFNTQIQKKNWGTYFIEKITAIDVNQKNEIYFSGVTSLENEISTACSYKSLKGDYIKCYIIKLNSLGQRIWGTYVGGVFQELSGLVQLDNQDNIYLFGDTFSNDGISTPNAHQTIFDKTPNNSDTFLQKFKDNDSSSNINITSNSPICFGGTLNLNATEGITYSWTGPNGFTSNEQNPTIPNATSLNTGQYSCAITGTGGCDNTITIDVLVGDSVAPIPDLISLPTITGDCNTIISTIPTATDNCSGSIQATTLSPLSYTLSGSYTIVWNYNDGNGNTSTQDQTVIITAQPLPTATSPQTFCIDQNVTLTNIVIQGQNILWFDALTGGNTLLASTPLQNGIIYYASQTVNGCESLRTPVTVNIQNTPIPTGISNQTLCANGNPTLNDIVVSGTEIIWYDSLVGGMVLPSNTALQTNTTYYCSQTVNGCESLINSFTIQLINTLNANDYSESLCDDLNDGSEIINLTNYNAVLISNPENYTFEYYTSFNGANNQIETDEVIRIVNYSLHIGANHIYVRINSANGCHQVVELNLSLFSKPVVSISDLVPICENKNITVNAGAGFDSYLWSTGATSSAITVDKAGSYNVTVTQNHGSLICSTTKNFSVVLSNIATINSIDIQDWTDNKNVIVVNTTGNGDYEYSVDGTHYQNSNTFTDLLSGTYTVTVRDKNGCGIVKDDVFLLMYPKFFTPNGDGYNDLWNIKFSNLEPDLTIKIFDRYGKFITTLNYNDKGWDGTLNGKDLPSTDYWFVVTRANGKEFKGHFSLKR